MLELIHAMRASSGTQKSKVGEKMNTLWKFHYFRDFAGHQRGESIFEEEWETVGFDGKKAEVSENDLRKQFRLPLRGAYGDVAQSKDFGKAEK